jgi:hypothetical protein
VTEVQALVADERTTVEKLKSLIAFQIKTFSEYFPAPFVYLARPKHRLDPRFDEWDDVYLATVERLLAKGVEHGEFRADLDVEMTARPNGNARLDDGVVSAPRCRRRGANRRSLLDAVLSRC